MMPVLGQGFSGFNLFSHFPDENEKEKPHLLQNIYIPITLLAVIHLEKQRYLFAFLPEKQKNILYIL